MKWTKNEVDYLLENYQSNPSIWEISKKLNKSVKSIHHKASRLNLSRSIYTKLKSPRLPRQIIDKKYYEKNKKEVYARKQKRTKEFRKELKLMLGGKCSKCGYNKCLEALDFHHDKGNKEGMISKLTKDFSKQKSLKEVKKCILLCANCHRELHANKWGSV